MTWGPTVISWALKLNRKCRHDGWELSELTGRRRNIDRLPRKIAQNHIFEIEFIKKTVLPTYRLANQQAEGGENHRCCNDRALKALGDEAKQDNARRNKGKAVCP